MYEYLIHNQATVIFNNNDDDDDDVTKIWRLPFHVCLTIHNSDQNKIEHNLKSQTFCQLLKYCCIQQSQFFFSHNYNLPGTCYTQSIDKTESTFPWLYWYLSVLLVLWFLSLPYLQWSLVAGLYSKIYQDLLKSSSNDFLSTKIAFN